MKRWLSMVLMIAAVLSALTVGASAAEGDQVELDNGLVIREIAGGKWEVMGFADGYTGSRDPLVIPSSYGSVGANNITRIADEAFKGAVRGKDIVKVIIPTSITNIGESAFEACPKLETVVFLEHSKDDPNKLTIEEKAFLGCRQLSNLMFSRGLGTIEPQAFGANLKLEEVVIPDGVEKIEERAFAQCANLKTIYIPASLKPAAGTTTKPIAATTFSGAALESIHYGGSASERPDIQLIMDLPTGMGVWTHVHAAVNDRLITEPTCIEVGSVYGGVSCNAAHDSQTDTCKSFVKIIDFPILGHDYQQTPDSKKSYEDALTAHEKEPCIDHDYEYEATCYRCGEEIEKETRTIPADLTRHPWKEDGTDKVFDETTRIPASCKGAGSVSWTRTCPVCGLEEFGEDKLELTNPDAHTHEFGNTVADETIEATCSSVGVEVTRAACDCGKEISSCQDCDSLLKAIEDIEDESGEAAATADDTENNDENEEPEETILEKRAKAIQDYVDHLESNHAAENDPVTFTVIPVLEHTWKEEYQEKTPPTCTKEGEGIKVKTCEICGTVEEDPDDTNVIPKLGHLWDKEDSSYQEEIIKEATCTEPGEMKITGKCLRENCDGVNVDGIITVVEEIPTAGHQWQEIGEDDYVGPGDKEPTCTEEGQRTTGARVCTVCGLIEEPKVEIIPPRGHDWDDFQPDPGQDTTQAEDCTEKKVTGTVSCKRDGCAAFEGRTIVIPGKMGHSWGDWVVTKEATATEDGERKRTCSVCKKVETQTIPKGSTTPTEPDDPDNPDNPGKPDDPSKPDDPDTVYTITVVQGTGGTITVSRTSAKAGVTITVTVTPNSGYELDMIRVIGDTTATDLTGSRRSFTMPASNVKVQASFERIESGAGWGGVSSSSNRSDPPRTQVTRPTQNVAQSVPQASAWNQLFSDIPTNHWAAGEINWANQMGYMNGTNGRFDPDGAITAQQMWMVLARLMGNYPASMADARRWAVENSFADGSSPTGPVSRHQLVTALYRCAHLRGTSNRNSTSLAGYVDSRLVPTVARDAFSWAISNGIITGDSSNRLNPTTTVTRAQFAVLLYRFSQRV